MIDNGRKRIIPNEVLLPEVARLISEGHTVTLTVRGNSMNPFLVDRRDRIILGPFTDDDLQPGVAVLARDTNGHIIFHRIIHRNGQELTLLGDGGETFNVKLPSTSVMMPLVVPFSITVAPITGSP